MIILLTGDEPYTIAKYKRIRKSIGYAIDRQKLIDTAFFGFALDSQTVVPRSLLGESAGEIEGYSYDPDLAKALLEKAGWRDEDGDGIREKDGRALRLVLINGFPDSSANG